jgi:transposase
MRGDDQQQAARFIHIAPEARVPYDHPLRAIRAMFEAVLKELSPQLDRLYAPIGRPSIAPDELLRALLLQVLYTVRSELLLTEQLDYNLLFRWCVGLNLDDPVWDPTTFTKTRERLLAGDAAQAFFGQVLAQARGRQPLSDEHRTVDGTLVEAWAGQKSFKGKGAPALPEPPDDPGNPSINFRGERRTNATHASTTAPGARLYKKAKGQEAKLCYLGHVLMENRHALGYAISQWKRKQVEEIFGWLKTVGLLRKTRHRGVAQVGWRFTSATAVYNLVRMRTLVAVA